MGSEGPKTTHYSKAYGHYLPEQNFIKKYYHIETQQQKQSFESLLNIVNSINTPTILKPNKYESIENGYMVIYQYYEHTLKKQINHRKQRKQYFKENQILNMIDCVLSGLFGFQYKNLYYGDLEPQRIICSKLNQQIYIIGLPILMNTITMDKEYLNNPNIDIYLSPQLLQSLDQSKQAISLSIQKNDVFSLGMICLEMATLQSVRQCYNRYQLNMRQVGRRIYKSRNVYSTEFCNLLELMLIQNQKSRINFQQLYRKLEPILVSGSYSSRIQSQQSRLLSGSKKIETINQGVESQSLLNQIYKPDKSGQLWSKFKKRYQER